MPPTLFTVAVTNLSAGSIVASRIELACTPMRRLVGLLGRRSLPRGQGLWIRPCSGVHTIGMLFPIDVVGLDRKHQVVKLWPGIRPFRVTSLAFSMHSALELAAGAIDDARIRLGDSLQIREFRQ